MVFFFLKQKRGLSRAPTKTLKSSKFPSDWLKWKPCKIQFGVKKTEKKKKRRELSKMVIGFHNSTGAKEKRGGSNIFIFPASPLVLSKMFSIMLSLCYPSPIEQIF